jgi:hypothetical protein
MLLHTLAETCKNDPPEAVLRCFKAFSIKAHEKVLKKNGV